VRTRPDRESWQKHQPDSKSPASIALEQSETSRQGSSSPQSTRAVMRKPAKYQWCHNSVCNIVSDSAKTGEVMKQNKQPREIPSSARSGSAQTSRRTKRTSRTSSRLSRTRRAEITQRTRCRGSIRSTETRYARIATVIA
jgi:hypothetical protein